MYSALLLLVAISLAIALIGTAAMIRLAPKWGLVAHPGERRIHVKPTPMGGGIAIFLGIWLPILAGVVLALYLDASGRTLAFWRDLNPHLSGVAGLAPRLGAIFAGAVVIFLLGLADDLWRLSPWLRLAVEALVALGLVYFGIKVSLFTDSRIICAAVTVLWIVGLINAFNMLDNMDGLSAGVAAIIALFFCIVAVQTGHYFIAAFLCCVIGSLLGFLLFNFPPAGIFMGDCGSTLIGYMLSVMTVEFTFFQPERWAFPVVLPLMVFGVPLFDMITVVWIRLRAGRSPFQGDTNHFSHRLLALGMTHRQAALTIYLVTATVALGATVLYYATPAAVLVIFAQTVAIFAIIGILERAARPDPARKSEPK
jgi:UDP-GlcNAc:undecaprenyl-phosphate GlcNAc-1-phosphate transferase